MEIKIKTLKNRLFDKTFLSILSEELVKKKLNLNDSNNRFYDAINPLTNERIEIKGTVVKDKGEEYRINKPIYDKDTIMKFINGSKDILEIHEEKMLDYNNKNDRHFVSTFNKIEFDKFDKFIGLIYFDEFIKVVSFDKKMLGEDNSLSSQFSDTTYSLALTRTNYKKILKKYEIDTWLYEDILKTKGG